MKDTWANHKGFDIRISTHGLFIADLGPDDGEVSAESFEEIKGKIEKHLKSRVTETMKLNLPIIGRLSSNKGSFGRAGGGVFHADVLIGINRATSKPIIAGLTKDCELDTILADTPENRRALIDFIAAEKQRDLAMKTIHPLMLDGLGYGRINIENYQAKVDELTNKYKKSAAGVPRPKVEV